MWIWVEVVPKEYDLRFVIFENILNWSHPKVTTMDVRYNQIFDVFLHILNITKYPEDFSTGLNLSKFLATGIWT